MFFWGDERRQKESGWMLFSQDEKKTIQPKKCLTRQRRLGIYILTEGADIKLTETQRHWMVAK
jgi:hypothetical protein